MKSSGHARGQIQCGLISVKWDNNKEHLVWWYFLF